MNKNIIICANCLDVIKNFPDDCIDMILTSPPYDDLRIYQGYEFNFEKVADHLSRILKPGGVIVWVVADATKRGSETGTSFKQALYFKEKCGLNIHDTMIYLKANAAPTGGNNRYYNGFEYMFVLSKGVPKTFNPIMTIRRNKYNDKRTKRVKAYNRGKDGIFEKKLVKINEVVKKTNVWEYATGGGNSTSDTIAFEHPAIFPEKLAEDHILSWTGPGDLIMDPFCGSGTTCKMAKLNDRNYIGIEISEVYHKIALKRIAKSAKTKEMF